MQFYKLAQPLGFILEKAKGNERISGFTPFESQDGLNWMYSVQRYVQVNLSGY